MDTFDILKADLDRHLSTVDANVGIAFGEELFAEFKRRDWFTLETFGLLGTSLFSIQVPAYEKTRFVFPSWDIGALEFKVGQSPSSEK
ncbi:hypothetical protein [Ottowia testudinis]|uniref:Uncharacterized protein n=1 Tax=Ottowia testudinis TaxID=2816950 RepID=A0A975CL96_9BURK|nr:hypothetical protein [Ottowia testudinis]QTD45553.1 hypothetical protein J1M35_01080 [Ottowia testudinis]